MGFDTQRRANGNRLNPSDFKPRDAAVRCPADHPAWHQYHKRVKGTVETIICCRECERTDDTA